ncbi:hypothetical protein [Neorhizobium sp. JUb45]|uniref:hypothetical protein n=1 Tax=Neorhizobium sp. JUb45 TaxID=2485113 RepID=UPI0010500DA6|nr:hypothetical protein [Neorhizobium sp. JUb45]TCR01061.1 hypothetical protein EDF70_10566 [Neorhizobium sp. JUb45]
MTDRRERILALSRRELAQLHAGELSKALFPDPETPDDAVSDEAKASIQMSVSELTVLHRAELSVWLAENE